MCGMRGVEELLSILHKGKMLIREELIINLVSCLNISISNNKEAKFLPQLFSSNSDLYSDSRFLSGNPLLKVPFCLDLIFNSFSFLGLCPHLQRDGLPYESNRINRLSK